MVYYAGQSISDTIAIEDWAGNPSTLDASVALSSVVVTHESGTAVTPVLVSNYTPIGTYLITFRTRRDLPGLYTLNAVASETNWPYSQTYEVLPVEQAGMLPEVGASGIIFSDFRIRVAEQLQDGKRLTATKDGDNQTFYDEDQLTDSTNHYQGSDFMMVNGLEQGNTGQRRRIASSSGIQNTIQFQRALPGITRAGDEAHLFNLGGKGFLVDVYNSYIRSVIAESYPYFLIPIERRVDAFPSGTRRIPIPEEFVAIHSIFLDDDDNDIAERYIPPSRGMGRYRSGFNIDKASREIVLSGNWNTFADGIPYRIAGYARHPIPQSDNDYIAIPETWLRLEVCSRMASRRRQDPESSGWAVDWGNAARAERAAITTPRKANTRFL